MFDSCGSGNVRVILMQPTSHVPTPYSLPTSLSFPQPFHRLSVDDLLADLAGQELHQEQR